MNSDQQHLVEMVKKFKAGMLVTKTIDDQLHGRPMEVAHVDEDGAIYFSASVNSPKLHEMRANPNASVFFQDSKYYVAVYGTAEILRDRKLIEELWQESWKVWFPKGVDSPEICIVRVTPKTGEYWDLSGLHGASFIFNAVKAYATGTKLKSEEGHRKVAM